MKNTIKLFGIIVIAAVIGLTIIACSSGGGIPNGIYESGNVSITISGNHITISRDGTITIASTYELKGGYIYYDEDFNGIKKNTDCKIEGNVLTFGGRRFTKK
ncbi:MAG: hypothetical protein LBI04_09600 [Treponema sp.]|jgi:hypothetical protein|nr:hypothetical protein [Treponema sp.]